MWAYVGLLVWMYQQSPEESIGSSGTGILGSCEMLGIKPVSWARTVSALNHGSISPASGVYVFVSIDCFGISSRRLYFLWVNYFMSVCCPSFICIAVLQNILIQK